MTIPVKGKQKEVRQVALASRLLQNVGGRDLDKVVKLPGTSEFQLVQEINVCFPGGENRRVRVLIDTGASVNLVRKGLFPESDFIPDKNPMQLSTANGQLLDGGQCTIKLRMTFGQDNGRIVQPWRVWGEFYEADTRADMILSYPWLGANHLAVIPEYGCLALRTSGFRFLPIHSCPEFDKGPEEEESQEIETGRGARVGCTPPLKKKCRNSKGLDWCGGEAAAQEVRACQILAETDDLHYMLEADLAHPLASLPFSAPCEHLEEPLGISERRIVAQNLEVFDVKEIAGVVAADGLVQGDLAAMLRQKLLEDYKDTVFRPSIYADPPERFPGAHHEIKLKPGAQPHYQSPFPMAGERRAAMEKVAKDWVAVGKVERPTRFEGWAAATFPILKKNGDWRGLSDERGLNSRVVKDNYPLPSIEGILERQGRRKMFSVLDLKDAFSQVSLTPACRHLTTIHTPLGLMQWKCLPQGYCNSPPFFQRVMDTVYFPVRDIVDNYIDDGILGTDFEGSEEDELRHHDIQTRKVLDVLAAKFLVLDPENRHFFARRVEFCGHILENGTRRPSPGKLRNVELWPLPETITELRAFLGFANYYHVYIPRFAFLAAPLMEKLKVGRIDGKKGSKKKVEYGPSDRLAFEELKKAMLSGLALQVVNPDRPFILRVDASSGAIGAALEQLPENGPVTREGALSGQTVPVAFMSRKLTPGQATKWPTREKEAYAIVCALEKWASWIGLQEVLVLTDHKSLENWTTEVLDSPTGPSGRQARWHLKLSRFNVAVGYVAGKDNGVADILSRWAYPAGSALKDVSIHGSVEDDEAMMAIIQKEKEEERQCAVLDLKWPAGLRRKSWKSGQQLAVVEVRKPRVLDLFCGGGSWSNYFRKLGFEVHSLDFDPKFRPTICADILEWDMQQFPPGFFDVVVASPPCEEFSFAKTRSPRDLAKGDRLVLRALQIVEYLQPSVWMLENPRALLVHRPYMQGIPFVDIDYCMFSDWGYRKRTRIWGSACIASLKSRLCDGSCGHVVEEYPGGPKRHEVWLGGRGPQVSWKDKIRIPERAVAYLCGGVGIRRRRRHKVAVVGQGEQKSQGSPKPGASEAAPPAGAAKFAFKSPPPGARRFRNTPPPPPAPVKEEEDDSPALGPDEGEPAPPEFGSPLSSLTPSERSWEEESVKDEDVEVKLEEESADLPEEPSVSVFDEDWAFWYRQSKWWSKPWRIVQRQGGDWPKGFQLHENRLFFGGKLCVPWGLTGRVVRAHHEAVGHIGAQRLWAQMSRFYEWADVARARFFSRRVQSQCELCQACEHPHHPLHMPIEPTPVPPRLMDNVCIDVFVMPAVKVGSESFDCFVACVDRLSGWIVAFPATKLGLSADKVAREMFARAWDLFGVPRVVSSDQGPQFASAWWHTLCGCLGIRQAFGHAYHHQANGRAEVAGKELQRKLRLLHGQGGGSNWVELLPVALRHIHDTPGVTGLSPYEIITGRHRNMVGVPYPVERQAQDALLFLERQKAMDKKVADLLNARHEREAAVENAKRRQVTVFIPGDKVWYLRPRSLGTNKTQSWWLGPCLVKARTGLASYVIQERPGFEHSAHRSQLKPHIEDPMEGDKLPLHFFRRTLGEELEAEDEWVVDRILKHRVGEDGKLQFLTKWEGFAETDATWEPVGHFFHRYSFPFVQYCKLHKIVFDAAQYLSTKPVERGVRPPSGSSSAGRRAEATRTS